MFWLYLIHARLLEVFWALSMKLSDGFTKINYALITIILMIVSFSLLALAMKHIPLGTAYVRWTGIGAIGAFLLGILFFGEAFSLLRILSALLTISGLILMKIAS